MPSTSTPAPNADGISEAPSGPTDADVAAVDTMMDELGLPADEKAVMDAMMAAAQAGETPSNEMIQKAQRAGEHMNKLLATAGADSTESSSTPMPSTSTPAPNADGISEAPSGPTDADVAAVDTMMDEVGLSADEKAAAVDTMMDE